MSTTQKFLTPPWDMDTAAERLKLEEAAWNSHNIDQVLEGYADNIEMRDSLEFINNKEQFAAFLSARFQKQQNYLLKLDLWGALKGRMAVRFEAEWQDETGQRHKSYGIQVLQFNNDGLIERRFASQESVALNDNF